MDLSLLNTTKLIGLGGSTFGGSNSQDAASRALHHAYEQGIVYFDVARSYGYGTAESILGDFAIGKRDKIYIASKFGIVPPPDFPFRNVLLASARAIRKIVPGTHRSLRTASTKTLVKSIFTPKLAEESLHKSLKELKTNYLDIFLLHESSLEDVLRDDLYYVLEKAKEKGEIRSWGATFTERADVAIAIKTRQQLEAVQLAFGLDDAYANLITQTKERIQIIYSVLNYANTLDTSQTLKALDHIKNVLPNLRTAVNIREVLMVLAYNQLSHGIMLLSMCKPEHIDRNTSLCKNIILAPQEVQDLQIILNQYFSTAKTDLLQ